MSDLVRKETHGIFETKNPTKDQISKYKRHEKEMDNDCNSTFMYVHSVHSDLLCMLIVFMSRIIKHCRGKKGRGKKNKIKYMILGVN